MAINPDSVQMPALGNLALLLDVAAGSELGWLRDALAQRARERGYATIDSYIIDRIRKLTVRLVDEEQDDRHHRLALREDARRGAKVRDGAVQGGKKRRKERPSPKQLKAEIDRLRAENLHMSRREACRQIGERYGVCRSTNRG